MKIYIDCKEDENSSEREIYGFTLNGKYYHLDYCVAGGSPIYGEAAGCQNFVCRIGKKEFLIYCEEDFTNGKLEQRYFILKD